ncbi:MAG: UTP--glucose-1-phosphate uridylyltransferase GalU [Thermoplasmata archaeon]
MKAVIPAAGLGTRFLPATKAQPKEMLPVVDKPTIQYVIEEAVDSGIDDILVITGRGKRAIENHFDKAFELEHFLEQRGDMEKLESIRSINSMVDIHYIRQEEPKGLGHAVYCARKYVGDEPFVVLLGDDIIVNKKPCVAQMIDIYKKMGRSVVAVESVPKEDVDKYGIVDGNKIGDNLYDITGLVEKPSPEEAPSNIAILGRYLFTPEIFRCIEEVEPGKGGEIQLTDAMSLLLKKQKIYAYEFVGERYDIGDELGWLKANIELALRRDDMKEELREYLVELIKGEG